MARHLSIIVILAIVAFLSLSFMMSFGGRTDTVPQTFPNAPVGGSSEVKADAAAPVAVTESKMSGLDFSSNLLTGDVIAPKLENATAKYVFSTRCTCQTTTAPNVIVC
jgi:hypothetical protein